MPAAAGGAPSARGRSPGPRARGPVGLDACRGRGRAGASGSVPQYWPLPHRRPLALGPTAGPRLPRPQPPRPPGRPVGSPGVRENTVDVPGARPSRLTPRARVRRRARTRSGKGARAGAGAGARLRPRVRVSVCFGRRAPAREPGGGAGGGRAVGGAGRGRAPAFARARAGMVRRPGTTRSRSTGSSPRSPAPGAGEAARRGGARAAHPAGAAAGDEAGGRTRTGGGTAQRRRGDSARGCWRARPCAAARARPGAPTRGPRVAPAACLSAPAESRAGRPCADAPPRPALGPPFERPDVGPPPGPGPQGVQDLADRGSFSPSQPGLSRGDRPRGRRGSWDARAFGSVPAGAVADRARACIYREEARRRRRRGEGRARRSTAGGRERRAGRRTGHAEAPTGPRGSGARGVAGVGSGLNGRLSAAVYPGALLFARTGSRRGPPPRG